jgi:hypothetical protein
MATNPEMRISETKLKIENNNNREITQEAPNEFPNHRIKFNPPVLPIEVASLVI